MDSSPTYYNATSTASDRFAFRQTPENIAIVASCIDGILILFGATVNIAVILTIVKHHRSLKTMDLLILNLCLSDFVSSIFYQPVVITRLLARSELNNVHTKILGMASFTCLLADCAALFLVTFDKYLGIRFPLRYHLYNSKKKVLVTIILAWVTAVTIGSFALVDAQLISGILYGMLLMLMFIITSVLQIASFCIAKRQARRIMRMRDAVSHNHTETRNDTPINSSAEGWVNPATQNTRSARSLTSKAAKTITLLTMVFITSWLPQIVLNVYFLATYDRKTFFSLIYLFIAFQQFHACINPFIYVFRTKYIREKFFGRRNDTINSSTYMGC